MSLDAFETKLIRMSDSTLISFLRYNNLLASTMFCYKCRSKLTEATYRKVKDGIAWYCLNKECAEYKIKFSIRKGSFFEGLNLSLMSIIKILIKWSCDQPQHSILKNMEINSRTYKKIILRVLFLVEIYMI